MKIVVPLARLLQNVMDKQANAALITFTTVCKSLHIFFFSDYFISFLKNILPVPLVGIGTSV